MFPKFINVYAISAAGPMVKTMSAHDCFVVGSLILVYLRYNKKYFRTNVSPAIIMELKAIIIKRLSLNGPTCMNIAAAETPWRKAITDGMSFEVLYVLSSVFKAFSKLVIGVITTKVVR